jgi:hypothetical protein
MSGGALPEFKRHAAVQKPADMNRKWPVCVGRIVNLVFANLDCANPGPPQPVALIYTQNPSRLSEPPAEEAEGAIPGLLRPDGVVLSLRNAPRPDGGLVGKGMACEVAVEVEGHAGLV